MASPSTEHLIYTHHILMYKAGFSIEDIYESIKKTDIDEEMKQRIRDRLRIRFIKDGNT